jgi:hypothetical protein
MKQPFTPSQITAISTIVIGVGTLFLAVWPKLVAIPGLHITPTTAAEVSTVGLAIVSYCRSLNPGTSGLSSADTKSVAAQTGTDGPTLGTTDTTLRP